MDPVLSTLGLSIAVIALVTQNGPQLAGQISKVRSERSKLLLDELHSKLSACHFRYHVWSDRWWDGDPSYDEQYSDIWGQQGWEHVLRSRTIVDRLVAKISSELGKASRIRHVLWSSSRDVSYEKEKKRLLQEASQDRTKTFGRADAQSMLGVMNLLPKEASRLLRKIWFALYRHESLETLAKELEEEIARLHEVCEAAFAKQGLHEDEKSLDKAIVTRTKTLIHVSRFASELYEKCEKERWSSVWIMHFKQPRGQAVRETEEFWRLVNDARLRYTVGYTPAPNSFEEKTLVFQLLGPAKHSHTRLSQLSLEQLINERRSVEYGGMLYKISERTVQPDSVANSLRSSQHELSDAVNAAIITTVWFMLVLRAGWVLRLCNCRVHRSTEKPRSTRMPSATGDQDLTFYPLRKHASDHHCSVSEADDKRLVIFGLMLGELLTHRPMRMSINQDGKKEYFIARSELPLSRNELVQKVEELVDNPVTDAFSWCMMAGDDDESRDRSPYATSVIMADKVLDRLVTYYAYVSRPRRSY